jgi:subtilisin-like proprotein convertase family protein
MIKIYSAIAAVALLGATASSHASVILDVDYDLINWGQSSGIVINDGFTASALQSIDSITIELSHSWASDIQFWLVAPDGSIFILTDDRGGGYNLGDGGSDLVGLFTYEFVQSASGITWNNSRAAGTYQAQSWISGPFAAGNWNLLLRDDTGADDGAVGNITINATLVQVPEPASLALLGLGLAGLGFSRRKNA